MQIEFPQGLPGFQHEHSFTLISRPEIAPLVCLQSADSKEGSTQLCLWAAPVDAIDPDYSLDLTAEDLCALGFAEARAPQPGADLYCLAILCATENRPLTANLLAPIVINLHTGVAVQAVRSDHRYSHQHPIGAAC